ncbi:hypothetical protein ASZ78_005377 [Callipepla squamata]|uniref:Uncharacterized protein n=1 Tax=Callipepla squamata TaxID=9009 RepID=A0A226MFP2_CALSU|nr:hypothetical protein ASZ78_005377 [Callipepla squamata]
MEEEPPSCPSVAWEESGSSRSRTPPPEPSEEMEVQVLSDDADWLPVYKEEKEAVDCIKAYTSDVHGEKDLAQKMRFLNSILTLCSTAVIMGLIKGLDVFCSTHSLAEHIEVLLLEEPTQQLSTYLRFQSMNAIAALSKMKAITKDEISRLLRTCFEVVFYLPPEEELSIFLYDHTLHAMDEMLQIVVDNYPTPSVTEELHGILEVCLLPSSVPRGLSDRICCALFTGTALGAAGVAISSSQANQKLFSSQVLLPFTSSVTKVVHDRAMVRMWRLCGFLNSSHWGKSCTLGHVVSLGLTCFHSLPPILPTQPLAERLLPSRRTDFVLRTLETTIKDSSTEDKERSKIILDAVLTEPGIWLMDVPQILGFIHRNLGSISTSHQHILFSVVDVLINEFRGDALMSVLTKLPQSDSSTLDIWRLMLHLPHPALIVEELYSVLHDQQLCEIFNISTAELGLLHLPVARSPAASVRLSPLPFFQVMPPTEGTLKDLCKPAALQNILKTESLPILWLGLRGLLLLSERRETAREIRALLPTIMETTSTGNAHVILEALRIFKNVMRHLGMREASSSAVALAEKMLPLFNHVSPLWEAKLRAHCTTGGPYPFSLGSFGLLWDVFRATQPSRPRPWQLCRCQ